MAKVYLNIEAENPADLHITLQEILAGKGAGLVVNSGAPILVEKPANTKKSGKAVQETAAATPADAGAAADPNAGADEKQPDTAPVENKQPEKVKVEDIRDALKALGSEKARALVAEFGGAKLTEVPEEKHAELLAEAKKRAAANG